MKVLVTGAGGFLGSHVVEEMLSAGYDVRALVRRSTGAVHLDRPGVERVLGDMEAPESLAAAVAGCESVVHCAGLTKARSEAEFNRVNAAGVANLLDAARRAGTVRRLVHVSSLAASGPSAPDVARTEDAPAAPITRYGRSKRRGEEEILRCTDLPVTILRPGPIYGPRDVEIFAAFRLAKLLRLIAIIGRGESRISMIYGPDCARALSLLAQDRTDRTGAIYHVDDGGRWSWADLGDAIGAALGVRVRKVRLPVWVFQTVGTLSGWLGRIRGRAVVFDRDKVLEMNSSFVGGHARILADYGWSPQVPFPEGARRSVAWYREQGWL